MAFEGAHPSMAEAHEGAEVHEGAEERILSYLRSEAYAVRDCFTRYSVQILAAAAAITVAIARFTGETNYIGLLGLFTVVLILLVFSMGVHKFGTSNRLLGYELHLQRTAHFYPHDNCQRLIETVGWEEAMRAWRIVHPTLFAAIYRPSHYFFRRFWFVTIRPSLRKKIEQDKIKQDKIKQDIVDKDPFTGFWFDQKEAFNQIEGVHYNPGGYLKTTISVFIVSILICFSLPVREAVVSWQHLGSGTNVIIDWSVVILVVMSALAVLLVSLNIYCRIKILENGLMSIHSAGIVWETTVLAHLVALRKLRLHQEKHAKPTSMHGYTYHIAQEALAIAKDADKIHQWIVNARIWLNQNSGGVARQHRRAQRRVLSIKIVTPQQVRRRR